MKCVIALSCILAVASAGYLNHAAPLAYANHGSHAVAYNAPLVSAPHPVHVGYAGPLAHAYAAHTGPVAHGYAHGYAHTAPVAHGYAHGYAHAASLASEARLIDPVAIAAGAPLPTGDTVEVAAAKAFHHQAHLAAKSLAHSAPIAHAYAHAAPVAHGYAHAAPLAYANHGSHAVAYNAPLVSAPHPVHVAYAGPLAHTYAAHTGPIAHGYAHGYAHATPIAHGYAHGGTIGHGYAHAAPLALASEARLVDPVAIAAGAPLPTGDTVEVAAAKAFHHQAHVEAKTGHLLAKGHYLVKRSPGYLNAGVAVATPLAYAAPVSYAVAAPAHSYSYSSQITHAAPVHSYGISTYAAPLAYAGHSGYGYGGHVGAYYG